MLLEAKQSKVKTSVGRKKNWIGHVMRGEGFLREVMEGKRETRVNYIRARVDYSVPV